MKNNDETRRPIHRFKPGESGNPHGRPPAEHCINEILRRIGREPAPPTVLEELRKSFPQITAALTCREAMLYRAELDAMKGDENARNFIAERTEGRVVQSVDHTTKGEKIGNDVDVTKLSPLAVEKITDALLSLRI